MSTNHQIDLIEFPANSAEELKTITDFFSTVFGWNYKDWGGVYSDTQDSGLTSGVIAAEPNRPTMPLTVIYAEDLEATKEKVITAGGTIIADIYPFPGGRRFHFTDPAGHELAVWSE
ncbi:MAG TPA: VOC family protein [Candidatus Saccharimonadales bacterium]|nr:VOC family protein [Candidatus Saccharimonadales bacterium]